MTRSSEPRGHYSVTMTERYAHLKPELFTEDDLATIAADLSPGDAQPVEIGSKTGAAPKIGAARSRHQKGKTGAVL
jgi:hypothetical protein